MNRDAKNISRSLRPQIEMTKGYIRTATTLFFGDGYPFRQAIHELRKAGLKIKYHRSKGHYTVER